MSAIPSVSELLAWLSMLLGGAIALSTLIKKWNMPAVLGFILLGLAIGPYGFNIIADIELINLFAELGIVILLFTIGLEFSIDKLRGMGGSILIISLIEQSIVFLLSFSIVYLLGWDALASLYIAGILAISSTAIILKLLQESGIMHTREANTIIGILIVEDLISILLLAILSGASRGGVDFMSLLITTTKIIAFFVITLTIGLKIVPKIMGYINRLGIEEAPFLAALALGFGLAYLASYLDLSIAIGAFLMGMIISSTPRSEAITHRILPLKDFFGTIFFISIGMLINITLFPEYIVTAIPLIIIAIIGKFVSNYIGAIMIGHDRISASTIGSMMIPRGEFSFIIAKQGVDLGVKAALLPLTMIISLVTMIIMPLILRILPTIMDPRTIFTNKIFAALEFVGMLLRNLIYSRYDLERRKEVLSKIVVNISIIVTIITLFALLEEYLHIFYNTFTVLQIMQYNVFKLIMIVAMTSYPVFNIFTKSSEVTESIIEAVWRKRIISVRLKGNLIYMYRIIRNIVVATAILLISSFMIPSIAITTDLVSIMPIASLISLSIFVYLIIDTSFVIHKRLEKSMITLLFKDSEKDELKS